VQRITCEWCGSAVGYDRSMSAAQITCRNCGGPAKVPLAPPPVECPPAADGDGFFDFLNQSEHDQESSPRKHGDDDFFDFLNGSAASRARSAARSSQIPRRGMAPIVWPVGIAALVGIVALVLVSAEGGHALTRDSVGGQLDESASVVIAVIDCLLLAAGTAVIWGMKTACPKCKGLWARQVARTKHLSSELGAATITRTDRHFSGFSHINQTGSTQREEQVLVTRSRHRHYCQCRWCGNRWSFVSLTERDGW
jgi:hypothetical protein